MGSSEEVRPTASPDDFLTPVEASAILKVGVVTVRKYIAHGILRGRRFKGQSRRLYVRKEEVLALRDIKHQDVSACELKDFLQGLKVRIHSVEARLDYLMRMLGLEVSVLRDKPIAVLLKIYNDAVVSVAENPRFIRFEQARRWSEIMCHFTELEFQRLVGPTQDIHPWKPIFNLCVNLLTDLRRRKRFGTDTSMQETYRTLDKARKQLSQAALVFEHSMASNFGPLKSARIHKIGSHADSLDRYIEAEVGLPDSQN